MQVMGVVDPITPWLVTRFTGIDTVCLHASMVCIDIVDIDINAPAAERFGSCVLARKDDPVAVLQNRHSRRSRRLTLEAAQV